MATRVPNVWNVVFEMSAASSVWHNTWQVTDLTAADSPPLTTTPVINHLVTFMENHHVPEVTIVKAQLRNTPVGTGPLPLGEDIPIWELSINQIGKRDLTYGVPTDATALDLRAVAYIRKVNRGRVGKLFIRDLLVEGDIEAVAGGRWTFTGGTNTVNPTAFAAQVAADLADYLTAGSATDYKLCVNHERAGSTATVIDTVNDVILSAGSWHRRRH